MFFSSVCGNFFYATAWVPLTTPQNHNLIFYSEKLFFATPISPGVCSLACLLPACLPDQASSQHACNLCPFSHISCWCCWWRTCTCTAHTSVRMSDLCTQASKLVLHRSSRRKREAFLQVHVIAKIFGLWKYTEQVRIQSIGELSLYPIHECESNTQWLDYAILYAMLCTCSIVWYFRVVWSFCEEIV